MQLYPFDSKKYFFPILFFLILMITIVELFTSARFMSIKNRWFIVIVCMMLASCGSVKKIDHYETQQYKFNDSLNIALDSGAYYLINPYRDSLNKIMNEILAVADQPLEKNQPEGLLGDFVADISLQQAQLHYQNSTIDFCVLNNGGLRASLPKGNITLKNIFELMPFENELTVLTITGSTANQLFNFIAAKNGMPVSHLQIKIKDQQAISVKVGNVDFDSTKIYRFVTSDYLANGGDNLEFLKTAINKEYINLKLRDAIVAYLKELTRNKKNISVALDKRISYER